MRYYYVKKNLNVIFAKNDLGNIVVKGSKGGELEGFIRHTEFILTDFYKFSLRISEEEFNETKRVFVYLRTKKSFGKHLGELTTYIKQNFIDAEVVTSGEKTKNKFYTIDLFLYK